MTTSPTLHDMAYAPTVDDHGVVLLAPEVETVPEDARHSRLVNTLVAGLRARFADRSDVAVHDRLAWFPLREDTRIRLDPDVMVVIGRPKTDERSSYRAWNEDGVAPTVVIEVRSDRDTGSGYQRRLRRAADHGVGEVVMVDPFQPGGVLVAHLLPDADRPEGYRTVATSVAADQPVEIATLGIALTGGDDLVLHDSDHGVVPEPFEAIIEARTLRRRADDDAQRADSEAARAERLAAQLRDLGIEPDAG